MTRTDIINHLIKTRNYKSYLEIGVQEGVNFNAVECEYKLGVDPDPESKVEGAVTHVTSDEFFEGHQVYDAFYDLIFIDGLHHSDQVLKDISNASKILNPGGIIVVHDANPQEEQHQLRDLQPGTWNGDVWKAITWLCMNGTELDTVDTDCGCCLITPPVDIEGADLEGLEWEDLVEHRTVFLNLISVDKFKEKYLHQTV